MSELIPHELIPPGVNDSRSRAFGSALGQQLSEFSISALLVQDPMTVDRRLLPSMVISLAMSEFVPAGLNESALRRLLAAAPEIHARTGTVAGSVLALSTIGFKVVWKQWFQMLPKGPHDTHVVTAYVNDQLFEDEPNLLSARTQSAARRLIESTQRWSQYVAFQIGVSIDSRIAAASACQAVQVGRFDAFGATPRRGRTGAQAATAAQALQVGTFVATLRAPAYRGISRSELATAAQALQLINITATIRPPTSGRSAALPASACQALQLGRFNATASHRRMR